MVYYITCWSGATHHLLSDYMNVTEGGERIFIDNNSSKETSEAIHAASKHVIVSKTNIGFALGNNQGFRYLSTFAHEDDIVCFINSDVKKPDHVNPRRQGFRKASLSLAESLKVLCQSETPSLYCANIGYQHVHGTLVPYAEGWCIAAKTKIWQSIVEEPWNPWNDHYVGPYWEDNDLSLRAMTRGVFLVHVDLPVVHVSGGTAGALSHHTTSYEENRRRYLNSVQESYPASWTNLSTFRKYIEYRGTPSDIHHHLELLSGLSRGFVIELGTRGGVSTTALLYGVERFGGHVLSIDVVDCSKTHYGNKHWTFLQADSRDTRARDAVRSIMNVWSTVYTQPTLLFIDTLHTYEHVREELDLWSTLNPKYIVVHDTESFPGVKGAIMEWIVNKHYDCWFVAPNNGIAIMRAR